MNKDLLKSYCDKIKESAGELVHLIREFIAIVMEKR